VIVPSGVSGNFDDPVVLQRPLRVREGDLLDEIREVPGSELRLADPCIYIRSRKIAENRDMRWENPTLDQRRQGELFALLWKSHTVT
jgi:hypothetical protein